MPKTKTKKVATRQKETRKKSNSGHNADKGGRPCHDSPTSSQIQPPPIGSRKRSRGSNIINQQSDATPVTSNQSPAPRTRQCKTAPVTNSWTTRQREMLGAPQPKQRRQEQSHNLTEEDIPRLVNAFTKA